MLRWDGSKFFSLTRGPEIECSWECSIVKALEINVIAFVNTKAFLYLGLGVSHWSVFACSKCFIFKNKAEKYKQRLSFTLSDITPCCMQYYDSDWQCQHTNSK